MVKYFKYAAAFIASVGSCFATTNYINGIDEDYGSQTTIRNDVVLLGGAGGLSGMTQPSGQLNSTTSIWNITFVQSGTNPVASTIPTGSINYPNTLTDLWITGDATNFETVTSNGAAYGLPAPIANANSSIPINIHFLLTRGPNLIPNWFTSALSANARIIVEPQSADPRIENLVSSLSLTNTLIIGSRVFLFNSPTIACAIQRHPKIPATQAHNKAYLVVGTNTTFSSPVNGISILGTGGMPSFSLAFQKTSDIIDINMQNITTITVNSAGLASGTNLTVVGSFFSVPTLTAILDSTSTTSATTNLITTNTAQILPALSPALNFLH